MSDLIVQTRALLSTTAAHWTSLAAALPEDLLTRPAADGQWSAAQCLKHLLDTETMVFPVRLRVFLESGEQFQAFDPDSEGNDYSGMTTIQLASEFARHRSESLTLLTQVTPEHLDRRTRHLELGPVSLAELLNEWAAHDLNHTVQAERAIMQAFIQGSGPWRSYFEDHDLGEAV